MSTTRRNADRFILISQTRLFDFIISGARYIYRVKKTKRCARLF